MHKTMAATALSFLLAVGGGAAFAAGGQPSSSSSATPSQTSDQAGSRADMRGPVGFAEEEVQTAPWTVERIDKQNRNLVLRAPDGTRNTVSIPSGTPGFDTLKKGDQVQLDYFDAEVVEPSPSAAGMNKAAPSKTANKKVRSIRKVDQNGNTGNTGNTAPATNTGGTSTTH